MSKLPDHVIEVLCEVILPTIRKTGEFSITDHIEKLELEMKERRFKSDSEAAMARMEILDRKLSLLTAWQWIATQS